MLRTSRMPPLLGPIAKLWRALLHTLAASRAGLLRIMFPTDFLANPRVFSVVETNGVSPTGLFTDGETRR